MTAFPGWISRCLAALLALSLCTGPELAQAWSWPQEPAQQQVPQEQQPADQSQTTAPNTGTTAPPAPQLPDAPSAAQQDTSQAQPAATTGQKPAGTQEAPAGAAAAPAGATAGGLASRPAGTAIAPAKQRQVRSLLIKLGAIAAAGAAIGTVVALTRGTSSVPPGAPR